MTGKRAVPRGLDGTRYMGLPEWALTLNDDTTVQIRFRVPESRFGAVVVTLTDSEAAALAQTIQAIDRR